MADIDFGSPADESKRKTQNKEVTATSSTDIRKDILVQDNDVETENDPNKITVTIADETTPLVILFGPPSCGKTMTLVRLARYLRGLNGYTIQPVTSFRPSTDKNYKEICTHFDSMINSENAADSTNLINFMLVKILYQGKSICQILEAPGEHYFNPQVPTGKPEDIRYINTIINSKNRKIWAIIVEPDHTNKNMKNEQDRKNYADKITNLKKNIKSRDKILFVFNKIDETPYIISPGKVQMREAMREIRNLYPNVFVPFKNEVPILKWWKEYNFEFIAFQTGSYPKCTDGTLGFENGHDIYPENFWKTIVKLIRG